MWFRVSYPTVQPACGHTASKATKLPDFGCTTREGSPVAGSVNCAAPPTGTELAGPILVPAGVGGGLVVVGGWVVGGSVGPGFPSPVTVVGGVGEVAVVEGTSLVLVFDPAPPSDGVAL